MVTLPPGARAGPVRAVFGLMGALVLVAFWMLSPIPATSDGRAYWQIDLTDLYGLRFGDLNAYLYSPAFAQLIYPLTLLPFDVFYKVIQAANLMAMVWLVGPLGGALSLLAPPVRIELATGQIHLWLAIVVVLSFRHPWLWPLGVLTKVTPGVSLFWWIGRPNGSNLRSHSAPRLRS